jgi:hypothetical protein
MKNFKQRMTSIFLEATMMARFPAGFVKCIAGLLLQLSFQPRKKAPPIGLMGLTVPPVSFKVIY